MSQEAGAPRPPGLVDSLSRLGRTALGVLRTRLEILGTELEEERIRFAQLALIVAAIAFCLQMAVLLLVAFLVVLFWDTHRLAGRNCGHQMKWPGLPSKQSSRFAPCDALSGFFILSQYSNRPKT